MPGRAKVSGHESFLASRRIEVARSYVEGLEAVRDRHQRVQADHMRLNHEAITLAAHMLVLRKLLRAIVDDVHQDALSIILGDSFIRIANEVLDNAESFLGEIYECPCGHSKFDHDADGCSYLHCRKVCT